MERINKKYFIKSLSLFLIAFFFTPWLIEYLTLSLENVSQVEQVYLVKAALFTTVFTGLTLILFALKYGVLSDRKIQNGKLGRVVSSKWYLLIGIILIIFGLLII